MRQLPVALPGLLLAMLTMLAAGVAADHLGRALLAAQGLAGGKSPLSEISLSVLLGLLVANTVGVPEACQPGLKLAVKTMLRLGIVLVGIRLSFLEALRLGAAGIPLVMTILATGLAASTWLARRLALSLRLGLLAAASTAICGVTAALAVGSAIEADDDEVAYTVANVTLFGLAAMLVYPYLAHAVFAGRSASVGLFLGTAIHDTAQVVGAALSYRELYADPRAFDIATVTKLTRNVFLVAVVPLLAWHHARSGQSPGGEAREVRALDHFPGFVLAFLGMALLRTIGDLGTSDGGPAFGLLPPGTWKAAIDALGSTASNLALGTAMAAVGLTTRLASLRKLGLRPFWVGLGSALSVGAVALVAAGILGPYVG